MSTHWYVATTKEQAEGTAADSLIEAGYRVYLPMKYLRQTDGRRVFAIPRLRFEGYIIVAFDLTQHQNGPIRYCRGVSDLLRSGEKPQSLPEGWVEDMRAYETLEYFRATDRRKPQPRKDIRAGDVVMIDRADHASYGVKGEVMKIENFIAKILTGMVIWDVPLIDLRKVEDQGKRAA